MPQLGFCINGKNYTFAEALKDAEEGVGIVPPEVVRYYMESQRDSPYPSGSVVGGCLRQFSLEREVGYYTPVQDGFPALMGTGTHLVFAKHAKPSAEVEQRLVYTFEFDDLPAPFNRVEFGGTPDYIDEAWDDGAGLIRDYKMKLWVPKDWYLTKGHRIQVNVYNAIRVALGFKPLRDWEVFYFDAKNEPKWQRGRLGNPKAALKWLRGTLHRWAEASSRGELLPPVPAFFETDKKGNPVAPCSYCHVRDECIARYNAQMEREVDEQADVDNDAVPLVREVAA